MYLYVCIDVRCIFSHYACACVCVRACFRWACNVTHANEFWVYLIMITCQRTGIKSSGWADFISSIRCQWPMHIPKRIRSCVPRRYIANIRYMCYAYIYCKDALPITHTYIAKMRCPFRKHILQRCVAHYAYIYCKYALPVFAIYLCVTRYTYIYCKYASHIHILQICVTHRYIANMRCSLAVFAKYLCGTHIQYAVTHIPYLQYIYVYVFAI